MCGVVQKPVSNAGFMNWARLWIVNLKFIDCLFLETIEAIIKASHSDKLEKIISLKTASTKLDMLKFFLQLSWEIKALDNKKYITISEKLNEIGKMLGGWIKALK